MFDITIRQVGPKDCKEVLNFLRLHYYKEEPLTIGREPKRQEKVDEEFTMSNVQYGTCLMALQQQRTKGAKQEKIVGAIMAGPKYASDNINYAENEKDTNSKWSIILKFLTLIEREADVFRKFNVESAIHIHAIGVDPETRGQSIGAKMIKELGIVSKKLGYPIITVDCSSHYSARLCENLGMVCINCIYYADYKDETGKQVFKPPAPHDCIKTYAMCL